MTDIIAARYARYCFILKNLQISNKIVVMKQPGTYDMQQRVYCYLLCVLPYVLLHSNFPPPPPPFPLKPSFPGFFWSFLFFSNRLGPNSLPHHRHKNPLFFYLRHIHFLCLGFPISLPNLFSSSSGLLRWCLIVPI